jgi:hypothetical protein
MTAIPTIKVKRDGPKGYRLINLSDFNPKVHVAFEAPARAVEPGEPAPAPVATEPNDASPSAAPVVAKGPRGLWFVMNGEERVSKGFRSEAEAVKAAGG